MLVDAAYGNDTTKRVSTTRFDFSFYVGSVIYSSKTQLVNAFSSIEADIIYDVTDSNTARSFRFMLQ